MSVVSYVVRVRIYSVYCNMTGNNVGSAVNHVKTVCSYYFRYIEVYDTGCSNSTDFALSDTSCLNILFTRLYLGIRQNKYVVSMFWLSLRVMIVCSVNVLAFTVCNDCM